MPHENVRERFLGYQPTRRRARQGLLKRRIAVFALIALLSMARVYYRTRLALYVYLLLAAAHFIPSRIDEQIIAEPAVDCFSKDSQSP
jgi:hypothetical protein